MVVVVGIVTDYYYFSVYRNRISPCSPVCFCNQFSRCYYSISSLLCFYVRFSDSGFSVFRKVGKAMFRVNIPYYHSYHLVLLFDSQLDGDQHVFYKKLL